ncbi:unnamed protein product, partial [Meganyctiphanes norvegica]
MAAATSRRLEGKTCLVTAAAQGIGRATVEAFVSHGAALVVAIDTNGEKLKELEDKEEFPNVVTKVLDVRDRAGINKLAEEFTGLDVLFNCAGYVHPGTILETTEERFDFSFDVNVKSMYHFIQAFLPKVVGNDTGVWTVGAAAAAAATTAAAAAGIYGVSKTAVIGLTKGVAIDYIKQGIRCNVICPSPVASPSFGERALDTNDSDKDHIDYIQNKLMGRLANAEEVANLCIYLASDESSYHTGNVFTIDGGFTL